MQYILTEEEYNELVSRKKKIDIEAQNKLQEFCTLAAKHIPAQREWDPDDKSPWGCVLEKGDEGQNGYCDDCPAQDICPYHYKEWSQ
jgi:hypothetical protein